MALTIAPHHDPRHGRTFFHARTRPILVTCLLMGASLVSVPGCGGPRADPSNAGEFAGPDVLLQVPVERLPAFVEDRYRIRPDRRFLRALEIIDGLGKGSKSRTAAATFEEGRWRVSLGDEQIGELSEFPGFVELNDFLVTRARHVRLRAVEGNESTRLRTMEAAIARADPEAVLSALFAIKDTKDVAVLALATGYAGLAVLTTDRLGLADPILARAWTWSALEATIEGSSKSANGVLVASALGYASDAANLALALPENEPLRLYARGNEVGLVAACEQNLSPACRLLHLKLLTARGHENRARSAYMANPLVDEPTLPVAGLALELARFEEFPGPGFQLAELALEAIRAPGDVAGSAGKAISWSEPGVVVHKFELALEQVASARASEALPADAITSFYRAAFYDGLHGEAKFLLDRLASGPIARRFGEMLAGESPIADELSGWIVVRAGELDGHADADAAIDLLARAELLGGAPLSDLTDLIARATSSTDPRRRRAAREVVARIDTRPAHRLLATGIFRRSVTSLRLYENSGRAAIAAAPYATGELPAVIARMDGDHERLRQIVDDPAMAAHTRSAALNVLWHLDDSNDAFIRSQLEEMATDSDRDLASLLHFLETRGDFAGALKAVESALLQEGDTENLMNAYLLTQRARFLAAMHRFDEAFEAIRPALSSYREDSLLEGATIEIARGRAESATELARAAEGRYPGDGEACALVVRATWALGDLAAAAREAARPSCGLSHPWNRYLPEAFVASFSEASAEKAKEAFIALQKAGLPSHTLARVAVAWGETGAVDPAVQLLDGLHDPAPMWDAQIRIYTYRLLKQHKSHEAALSWLRIAVPRPTLELASSLYQAHEYELLLELFAPGSGSAWPPQLRVLQAASLLHLAGAEDERWSAFVNELEETPVRDEFFIQAARVLAGTEEPVVLFPLLKDLWGLATLGWVMGVRAASLGQFEEADSWFQVALETEQVDQPPHAWSWEIESGWLTSGDSLSRLEAAREF